MPIVFRSEKISFIPKRKKLLAAWIESLIRTNGKTPVEIHFVFCSDAFLLLLNKKYLKHDTFTDIITFDYSEEKRIIGEIYISIPRVKSNAKEFKVEFENELERVIIHGILHLLGYDDKTKKDKAEMRKMEDACLKKLEWK